MRGFFFWLVLLNLLFSGLVLVNSDDLVVADNPPVVSPFIYVTTYAPVNSFGMSDFTEQLVNWSWIDNQTSYILTNDGVNCTQLLTINFSSVFDPNIRKYSYVFVPDKKGYYELNLSFDSLANTSWVNESEKTVYFNYSVNEQLSYNFTDLYQMVGDFDFQYSLSSGVFNLKIGTTVNPSQVGKVFELDPTFGNTLEDVTTYSMWSSTGSGSAFLRGSWAAPESNGVIDNITIKTGSWVGTVDVQCAIYEFVDNTTNFAGNVLGWTETKSILNTDDNKYITFNMEGVVNVVSGTNYYLLIIPREWADIDNRICGHATGNGSIYKKDDTSPLDNLSNDPLTGEIQLNLTLYIYASYTVSGGETPWTNVCPVGGNFTPANQTVDVCLKPTVSIVANDSNGGSNLTVNFYENSTGSWILRQTNSSVVANSTVEWNFSQANTGNTEYWWNVTIYDNECNMSYWQKFTTIANVTPPAVKYWLIVGDCTPANKSISVSLVGTWCVQINDFYGNPLNWSIDLSNGDNSNGTNALNGSKCLTYRTLVCGRNYTVWLNVSNGENVTNNTYWFITTSCIYCPVVSDNSTFNLSYYFYVNLNNANGSFNYSIECNNSQSISGSWVANGTYGLLLFNLSLNSSYTVWVNTSSVNSTTGSGCWDNHSYIVDLDVSGSVCDLTEIGFSTDLMLFLLWVFMAYIMLKAEPKDSMFLVLFFIPFSLYTFYTSIFIVWGLLISFGVSTAAMYRYLRSRG